MRVSYFIGATKGVRLVELRVVKKIREATSKLFEEGKLLNYFYRILFLFVLVLDPLGNQSEIKKFSSVP